MANTYTQIYIPIVFAVQGRQNPIRREHNDELQTVSGPTPSILQKKKLCHEAELCKLLI